MLSAIAMRKSASRSDSAGSGVGDKQHSVPYSSPPGRITGTPT